MKIFSAFCAIIFVLCITSNTANESKEKHPTSLIDLPAEILLDIFERLDFKTLIRVGVTHPQNLNIVDMIFRKKFNISNGKIEIAGEELSILGTPYQLSVKKDLDVVFEFLQYFGHWITNLKLKYDWRINQALGDSINIQIRKYVVEFINELDLRLMKYAGYMDGEIKELNVPFPNAKIVIVRDGKINVTTLQHMFPAVCRLDLETIEMEESLNHFPHLEHLSTPQQWDWINTKTLEEKLEQTLQMNPQLRHLTLKYCRWDVAEMLARVRPDLESLEILNFQYHKNPCENGSHRHQLVDHKGGPIQFNRMKKFKFGLEPLSLAWEGIPTEMLQQNPFVFGSLEEFEFRGREGAENWVRVMLENKSLKKIIANDALNDEQLDQIADGLEKLEEFTMQCKGDNDAPRRLVEFMGKAKTLKSASFLNVNRGRCPEIAERISEEWENVEDSKLACSFVRK